MKIRVEIDKVAVGNICKSAVEAAEATAYAIHTKVQSDATMPFRKGNMQALNGADTPKGSTSVEIGNTSEDEVGVYLANDAPQAQRLYHHPEYNFYKAHNANAGAGWWDDYLAGRENAFIEKAFSTDLKRRLGEK